MKRNLSLISLILSIGMVFGFTGCSADAGEEVRIVEITYETQFGSVPSKKVQEGYVLTKEDLPVLTQTGYSFGGWSKQEGDKITEDTTITAIWAEATDTSYKVEHYQQNIENNEYSIVTADTENKTGTTFSDTEAVAKTYEGFTPKAFNQEKIAADGSTVVKIYYERNSYTIKFDTDGGSKIDDITLKFGAEITMPENPSKSNYEFEKWSEVVPSTMPAENLTVKAIWKKVESSFSITLDKNNDIQMSFSSEGNMLYFEVPAGYDSYTWYLNGVAQSEKTNRYSVDITTKILPDPEFVPEPEPELRPLFNMLLKKENPFKDINGYYEVLAVVKDSDGQYYSATATFLIQNISSSSYKE